MERIFREWITPMKKLFYIIPILLMLVGCGTLNPLTKQAEINKQKLSLVSQMSYQAQHTTNPILFKAYNERVLNLVGEPNLKDTSKTNFDKDIYKVQLAEDKNQLFIENQAQQTEALNKELDSYKSYWGLGAIFLGAKSFLTHSLWALLIFGVLFIVLRILAASNPIANAIFSIFSSIGASIIHGIGLIVPKAIEEVKGVSQTTLTKVVDTIQSLKETNGANINTIKTELSNKLTDKEKAIIAAIKKDLFY